MGRFRAELVAVKERQRSVSGLLLVPIGCSFPSAIDWQVAWVHLDRQMIVTVHRQVVTRIPRFSVSHDHQRTWLLHIRGAQPEDAGRYMCTLQFIAVPIPSIFQFIPEQSGSRTGNWLLCPQTLLPKTICLQVETSKNFVTTSLNRFSKFLPNRF